MPSDPAPARPGAPSSVSPPVGELLEPSPPRGRRRGWQGWHSWQGLTALLVTVALGVVLVGLAGRALLGPSGSVPRGTEVLGVEVGGLSRDDAAAKLDASLGDRARTDLLLRAGDRELRVTPAQAGLRFDPAATAQAAESAGLGGLVRLLPGLGAVEPVVHVDERKLQAVVERAARQVDRPATEGGVRYDGVRPVATAPVDGQLLSRDGAARTVREAYLAAPGTPGSASPADSGDTGDTGDKAESATPVRLPVTAVPAAVTQAEVDRVLREVAQPAVARPVTVAVQDARVRLSPETVAAALRFTPDPTGRLTPTLDGQRLRAAVLDGAERARPGGAAALERAPKDAGWRIVAGRPAVVPGEPGTRVDPADVSAAVAEVLPVTEDRVARLTLAQREPERTTAEATALGVVERLSTYTQKFPYAEYRIRNIGTASGRLDGTVLLPGEVFSLNEVVKERTAENGYTKGGVIEGGRLRRDFGGGVSTLATTVWNAAFYAGMERVEQRAHSFHISRYPPGLEATVVWGALDLRFRNDGDTAVLVTTDMTDTSVTVSMWGTKRYEVDAEFGPRHNYRSFQTVYDSEPDCLAQTGAAGFDIDVTRVFSEGGREVRRETFPTRYNPADEIHCRPGSGVARSSSAAGSSDGASAGDASGDGSSGE